MPLCLAVLALLTLINPRGVRSTGILVLLPTYSFVLCLFAVIAWGLLGSAPATAASQQDSPPHAPLGTLTFAWLVLRAFARLAAGAPLAAASRRRVPAGERGAGLAREPLASGGLQHHLLASVQLVHEQIVAFCCASERQAVSDHEARVDLAVLDPL